MYANFNQKIKKLVKKRMNSSFIIMNKKSNEMEKTLGRTGLEGKLEAQFWTFQFDSLIRHLSGEILWQLCKFRVQWVEGADLNINQHHFDSI